MSDEALAGNGERHRMCVACHKMFNLPYGYRPNQGSVRCPQCRRPPSRKNGDGDPDKRAYDQNRRKTKRGAGWSTKCVRGEHRKCVISICTCDCHKAAS